MTKIPRKTRMLHYLQVFALPETNKFPLKIGHPSKGKVVSPPPLYDGYVS